MHFARFEPGENFSEICVIFKICACFSVSYKLSAGWLRPRKVQGIATICWGTAVDVGNGSHKACEHKISLQAESAHGFIGLVVMGSAAHEVLYLLKRVQMPCVLKTKLGFYKFADFTL